MKRACFALVCLTLTAFGQENFDLCKNGYLQSPIDINHVEEDKLPSLVFKYQEGKFKFSNHLPTNLFAVAQDDLFLEVQGVPYRLSNIHVHTPGEHRLAGKTYPLEIHFVHQSFEGNIYTVAQWVQIGRNNPALQTLLENFALGKAKPSGTSLTFGLDPSLLLSAFHNYFTYQGSETYSPCEENVTWYVLKNTLEVGKDQIMALHQLLGNNSRPIQALNARVITASIP